MSPHRLSPFSGGQIEDPIAILHNEGAVSLRLLFDPYEPFLIAANEQAQINVWNYSTGQVAFQLMLALVLLLLLFFFLGEGLDGVLGRGCGWLVGSVGDV